MIRIATAALLVTAMTMATPALAAGKVPAKVGQCVTTKIEKMGTRLDGVADSGDAIAYANGIFGVTYDQVEEMHSAKAGDGIKLCLTSLPKDCPAGDERGKVYKATDQRTGKSWELPDAEHMCGDA